MPDLFLPKSFYTSEDVAGIARSLLGKIIKTGIGDHQITAKIVETEAYRGPDDKGCHAYNNRRTPRTEIMYAEGGVAYMYKCYGIHNMLNVVTGSEGKAHAVLIRSVEIIDNIDLVKVRRKIQAENYLLTGGPGKVCESLGIDLSYNGASFLNPEGKIQILTNGTNLSDEEVVTTPRVGMSRHVAEWANSPWRFYIKGNKCVSRPLQLQYSF